jgi:hypothetical protein
MYWNLIYRSKISNNHIRFHKWDAIK